MKIDQIYIDQSFGKIGLDIKQPQMEIDNPDLNQLKINSSNGKLSIKQKMIKVEIDTYPHYYDLGLYNPGDFIKSNVKKGKKAALKSINQYVSEGNRMMNIQDGSVLKKIFREHSFDDSVEVGLKWKRGPKTSVQPADIEMNYHQGRLEIDNGKEKVNINLKEGQVNIKERIKPQINIGIRGKNINISV